MRLIDADALMEDICESLNQMTDIGIGVDGEWLWGKLNDALEHSPTIKPERKKGKWIDRKVIDDRQDAKIQQWQSCKCSICGRYDTRPYLYYFSEPRFCSWCGSDMRGEGHETD